MDINNTTTNSNTSDQYDIQSMEILNKCHLDLFPKKRTILHNDLTPVESNDIEKKLILLSGESIAFIGRAGKFNEDFILITDYRLFLLLNNETAFINFPIMLIEYVEMKEIFYIYVYLKNIKTVKLTFSTNDKCLIWYQRLLAVTSKISKLDELFALRFYSWYTNENQEDVKHAINKFTFDKFDPRGLIKQEYERMEFDKLKWRLSRVNEGYKVCQTYPELLIVPEKISDEQLHKIASFRSSKRFPTVVWKSKLNNCIIARSSQPNVGLLAWRLAEDELLIKEMANNCCNSISNVTNAITTTTTTVTTTTDTNTDSIPSSTSNELQNGVTTQTTNGVDEQQQDGILLIIDARCRSVALANRVKGGGYEYIEYYKNCEIQFMNLENIHVIRSSFQSLRTLCQSITDNKQFYSQLEHTKWLHHLSGIIKAARTVVYAIDRQSKPVLIHCSDGWDRTPQVLALAKILLDPYYRTIKGFQVLIELDWLMYGHKFAQRNGHAVNHTDINERCPVFLQWLDCVFQMLKQFPYAFEFNETFLIKLCYHSYSCLFGTFLCDSYEERYNERIYDRTFSVWSYLNHVNHRQFINYLYNESFDDILYPQYELANLTLWTKLFCDTEITYLVNRMQDQESNNAVAIQQPQQQQQQQVVVAANSTSTPITTTAAAAPQLEQKQQQIVVDDNIDQNYSFSFSPPTQITQLTQDILSTSSSSSTAVNDVINTVIAASTDSTTTIDANDENTVSTMTNTINSTKTKCQVNNLIPKLASTNNTLIKTSAPVAIINRTRSFDNIYQTNQLSLTTAITGNDSIDHLNGISNATLNTSLNAINSNGDPIQIRSCSESNLLADALENFGTTPIFTNDFIVKSTPTTTITTVTLQNDVNNSNSSNSNNNSSSSNSPSNSSNFVLTNKIKPIKYTNDKQIIINGDLNDNNNSEVIIDDSNLVNNVNVNINCVTAQTQQSLPIDISTTTTTTMSMSKLVNKKLQKSTDTLVDDDLASKSVVDDDHDQVDSTSDNENKVKIVDNNNIIENTAMVNNDWQLKNVSTSTSGLSDYVYSTQIRVINDTIKKFEQTFNNNNHHNSNNNQTGTTITTTSLKQHVNGCVNHDNQIKKQNNILDNHDEDVNSDDNDEPLLSSNQPLSQPPLLSSSSFNVFYNKCNFNNKIYLNCNGNNHNCNNNNNNYNNNSNKKAIVNGYFKNNEIKKKKCVSQLLDLDGLTVIDDNCFKRLIEKEDIYKRENYMLKQQLHKIKQFLSNLTANPMLFINDLNYDFGNDFEKKLSEENGRSYSFSNDSTCSSWDEVEEPEYKLTTWIPDHYVTHCQNCNQKFSVAVRKHHCRNCGHVFCNPCSNNYYPLPHQNLMTPQRVCLTCKPKVEQLYSSSIQQHVNNNNNKSSQATTTTNSTYSSSSPTYKSSSSSLHSKCNGTYCCNLNANRCSKKVTQTQLVVNDHKSQKVSV